jgi:two-component system response regulator DevR
MTGGDQALSNVEGTVIRVFGLAGNDAVRQGVLSMIDCQPDMSVVGQAVDAHLALPTIIKAEPDVIMVDAHLARQRAMDACPAIRQACPSIACVLMASMADERTLVEGAIAGAATIVPKQLRGSTMVDTIRAVAEGARLFDFAGNRYALDRLANSFTTEPPAPLRQLLELMSTGWSRDEIADELDLSGPDAGRLVDRLLEHVGLQPTDYHR